MACTNIEAQGVTIARGDGGGPETFNPVGSVVSFDGPGGSAQVIDASCLDSTAMEKRMGLADEGQITLGLNLDPDNVEHIGLKDDRLARTLRNFELTLTDTTPTVLSFSAFVLGFSISGAVNDLVKASVTLEVSGAVVWA